MGEPQNPGRERGLDIILSSRAYDLGFMSDWGGAGNIISTLYSAKSTNFASTWAKIETKARTELANELALFRGFE